MKLRSIISFETYLAEAAGPSFLKGVPFGWDQTKMKFWHGQAGERHPSGLVSRGFFRPDKKEIDFYDYPGPTMLHYMFIMPKPGEDEAPFPKFIKSFGVDPSDCVIRSIKCGSDCVVVAMPQIAQDLKYWQDFQFDNNYERALLGEKDGQATLFFSMGVPPLYSYRPNATTKEGISEVWMDEPSYGIEKGWHEVSKIDGKTLLVKDAQVRPGTTGNVNVYFTKMENVPYYEYIDMPSSYSQEDYKIHGKGSMKPVAGVGSSHKDYQAVQRAKMKMAAEAFKFITDFGERVTLHPADGGEPIVLDRYGVWMAPDARSKADVIETGNDLAELMRVHGIGDKDILRMDPVGKDLTIRGDETLDESFDSGFCLRDMIGKNKGR